MKVQIKIFDVVEIPGTSSRAKEVRTELATISLPTSHELGACNLIQFAEANFNMGVVDSPLDYYAGLRGMFVSLLSAHHIRGLVVVEAKIV